VLTGEAKQELAPLVGSATCSIAPPANFGVDIPCRLGVSATAMPTQPKPTPVSIRFADALALKPEDLAAVLAQAMKRQATSLHIVGSPQGKFRWVPNVINKLGGKLTKPRRGAKGIAGVRADLRDGLITVREISMMPSSVLAKRYRVSDGRAYQIREHVAQYGIDGKLRRADNSARVDLTAPATATAPQHGTVLGTPPVDGASQQITDDDLNP
jgi:hypothetical protein